MKINQNDNPSNKRQTHLYHVQLIQDLIKFLQSQCSTVQSTQLFNLPQYLMSCSKQA